MRVRSLGWAPSITGDGALPGYTEAAKFFRMAAGTGHAEAMFKLGLMYAKGQGVPEDASEAAKLFRRYGS